MSLMASERTRSEMHGLWLGGCLLVVSDVLLILCIYWIVKLFR